MYTVVVAVLLVLTIQHYGSSATSCSGLTKCVSAEECQETHRNASSEALQNRIIFRCGDNGTFDCCPLVDAPHRSTNVKMDLMPADCSPEFGDRIALGNDTDLGEFPWMALIGIKANVPSGVQFICGGSVINKRYVLTAAHCVLMVSRIVTIRLAEYDLNNVTDTQQVFLDEFKTSTTTDIGVSRVIKHPQFNTRTLKHDIALIRVKADIDFSTDYIKPICLPFTLNDMVKEGENYTIAGWGITDSSSTVQSNVLQKATVFEASGEDCDGLVPRNSRHGKFNNTLQICAPMNYNGGAVCNGDSGGPLMGLIHTTRVVVGVVSLGLGMCGDQRSAGVFTRVHPYLDWLLDTVEE